MTQDTPRKRGWRTAVGASLIAAASAAAVGSPLDRAWLDSFDKAWQIISDTYYDPSFNGVDWEKVWRELRPRAEAAATPDQSRAVIREMIGRLRESHFVLLPEGAAAASKPSRDTSGEPGFEVRYVNDNGGEALVVAVDESSAARAAGVQPGWIVLRVDGEALAPAIAGAVNAAGPRLAHLEAWRAITERLRGPVGSTAQIAFLDGSGTSRELRIDRRAESGEPVTLGSFPTMRVRTAARTLVSGSGSKVGYIRFNVWLAPIDAVVAKAVDEHRSAPGIVVDVRGNPGGLAAMIMGIAGQFTADRVSLGEMHSRDGTLKFFTNPRRVSPAGKPVSPFGGRVAILIDALTGSASECFAGGMQSIGRARVFGERTMGQALPALFDRLPSGDVLVHAYADFVTATGARIEGLGVAPDVVAPWSRGPLLAGHDLALEQAADWAAGSDR